DAEEVVRAARGENRVDRDADVAVGAVLESDRRRGARREFAEHLALGRARADRAPGDDVGQVLRRRRVEQLADRGPAEPRDVDQQRACDAQALVDAATLVEVRVVDQALPADRGARLLEVDAHHDVERVAETLALLGQPLRIVERRARIVNRARADHDQQPVVVAAHDPPHGGPALADQPLDARSLDREEADQVFGRRQDDDLRNALVVGGGGLVGLVGAHCWTAGSVSARYYPIGPRGPGRSGLSGRADQARTYSQPSCRRRTTWSSAEVVTCTPGSRCTSLPRSRSRASVWPQAMNVSSG